MKLQSLIDEQFVVYDCEVTDKQSLFQFASELLYKNERIENTDLFLDAVNQRESLSTTGIGHGIAIPHAKSTAVKAPTLLILKLKQSIAYDALDQKPVSLVFMIAMPKQSTDLYLQMLSLLSRRLTDKNLLEALKQSQTKARFMQVLTTL